MQKQKYFRLVAVLAVFVVFQFVSVFSVQAQDEEMKPDLSVAGIELGNRDSAKAFLKEGHIPRVGDDGRPAYYFYNTWGSQVMKMVCASLDDPYFITEIEVFSVTKKYQKRHYQNKEVKYFETESGVFIGFKQSAMHLIVGIRNAGSVNVFKPNNVVKIKGEPKGRVKNEKNETLSYEMFDVKLSDKNTAVNYAADYEFYKGNLKRFSIKISPPEENIAKKK